MRLNHRTYQFKTPSQHAIVRDGTPAEKPPLYQWGIDMAVGLGDEADFPDVSGFAPYSKNELLAVRDTKPYHFFSSTFGLVDKQSGKYRALDMNSCATGKPYDLEAVTATDQPGRYLAVEGSRLFGRTPKMFTLMIDDQTARTVESFPLPDLDQEVEGVAIHENEDGRTSVLLAGRGGDGAAKLYWGELTEDGLNFSEAGRKGVEVPSPGAGEKERGLTDLGGTENGELWATSAADAGGVGKYRSTVRRVGRWGPGPDAPFTLDPGDAYVVEDCKVEALSAENATFYLASDNESLNGRFRHLSNPVRS